MIIQFHIHYNTIENALVAIHYKLDDGNYQTAQMLSYDGENWIITLDFDNIKKLEYRYALQDVSGVLTPEWGQNRVLHLSLNDIRYCYVNDFWSSRENVYNAFLSSTFSEAIFSRKTTALQTNPNPSTSNILEIYMVASLPKNQSLGLIGNIETLGKWLKPIPMIELDYPVWKTTISIEEFDINLQYKFVLLDAGTHEIIEWEVGENRSFKRFFPEVDRYACIINEQHFKYGNPWKGAGVAIPVFSLRSKNGLGIGEFSDLLPLIDWSQSVSLKMIQVLPVNDTIANKTWQDSYPYAAISVFALHPLYVNIEKTGSFEDKSLIKKLEKDKLELNKSDQIDFEIVLQKKMYYFELLFEQEKSGLPDNKNFQNFCKENSQWLPEYSAFCALRDVHNSCIFSEWKTNQHYDEKAINEIYKNDDIFRDKVDFYTFIQYHAHLQLTEVRDYARSKGIALKGDLPIGIYRNSCDAWVAPHLYNMDEQAGAPPDDFSELGQNWGFPTYNWQEMSKDNFNWWKARLQKLNEYFDALRIDHILGFFRIWQIPTNQISGTLGLFNPRIPFSRDEIIQSGLTGQIERFTKPFLTEELILSHFSKSPEFIKTFFDKLEGGMYRFKSKFRDQVSIQQYLEKHVQFKEKEAILLKLFTEVIFIEETVDAVTYYNPRITVQTTYSYTCLEEHQKRIVQHLYNQYYFERHDEYWKKQALWKLPALLDATNMLICGEDLGMIPNSVPGVMQALNIMSLEIQRMPKGNARFGNVQEYPYFSVSSPSCHDMSTIRGWWENDHEMAKEFYYQYMHGYGFTPAKCEPRIVQYIIEDHLSGPSMLAIFPLQDLIGIDADLRRMDADAEQINDPSNSKHYWRFRFHINVEDLKKHVDFNQRLQNLIQKYRDS